MEITLKEASDQQEYLEKMFTRLFVGLFVYIFVCFEVHDVFFKSLDLLPSIYNFISIPSLLQAIHVEFFQSFMIV